MFLSETHTIVGTLTLMLLWAYFAHATYPQKRKLLAVVNLIAALAFFLIPWFSWFAMVPYIFGIIALVVAVRVAFSTLPLEETMTD